MSIEPDSTEEPRAGSEQHHHGGGGRAAPSLGDILIAIGGLLNAHPALAHASPYLRPEGFVLNLDDQIVPKVRVYIVPEAPN
jgi:hypothetical protein